MKMKKGVIAAYVLLFFHFTGFAQNIHFNELPAHLQLFPRDEQDSSIVPISGVVADTSFDSVKVEVYKDSLLFYRQSKPLIFTDTVAVFSFEPKIFAECAEYYISVYLDTVKVAQVDSIVCGDVYLINGQSNALAIDYEGKATYKSEWLRSFGNSSQTDKDCRNDVSWGLAQGTAHFSHAAVGVWGLKLGQSIVENDKIPLCILNGATGGSYIADHLRKDSNPTDLKTNYGRLLWRTKQAKVQHSVKAICWNQGEMNTDNSYAQYADQFDQLYSDWQQDYSGIKKIYIFQIRPCHGERSNNLLREIQRQIAERYSDVEIMSTVGIPGHNGLHYNFEGYSTMGFYLYRLIARDFYGSTDTLYITPPKIKAVYYSDVTPPTLKLIFDQPIIWPNDTLNASMKDNFFLVGDNVTKIDSGFTSQDTVFLRLSATTTATGISYIPNKFYHGTSDIYEGPWLRNPRSVGALTFLNYPILLSSVPAIRKPFVISQKAELEGNYPNPFNAVTKIKYSLSRAGAIKVEIFNLTGQLVENWQEKPQPPGEYFLLWQPLNLSSGIYWCRFYFNGDLVESQRLIYLK